MTKLKYNDINTNREIFLDSNGVFFPQNGKLQIFFIFQIGKHYLNVPTVIQVFKLKNSIWLS